MEYHLSLDATAHLEAIQDRLVDLDPAAIVDAAAHPPLLRVSTYLPLEQLLEALQATGLPARAHHVEIQPSVCCGGCSFG